MPITARGVPIWVIGVLSLFWPIVVRDHTGLHTVPRDDLRHDGSAQDMVER